jgi:hypothetical protein
VRPCRMKVECLLDPLDLGREQAVAVRGSGVAQGRRRTRQRVAEAQPVEASPFAQRVARREVGIGDTLLRVDQHQRHGRVLHDRIQQQLALHQMRALRAQGRG